MTWPKALRVDSPEAPGGWWGDIYPIGAIYLSVLPASPSDLLGFGTWAPLTSGQLLLAGTGPASVGSVISAPPSVTVQSIPTLPVFAWHRTA